MGKFKDIECQNNIIKKWLLEKGYIKGKGAQGQEGLVKTYSLSQNLYTLWVTISLADKEVYVYKDLCCGGYEGSKDYILSVSDLATLDNFINRMDEIFEDWI